MTDPFTWLSFISSERHKIAGRNKYRFKELGVNLQGRHWTSCVPGAEKYPEAIWGLLRGPARTTPSFLRIGPDWVLEAAECRGNCGFTSSPEGLIPSYPHAREKGSQSDSQVSEPA